MRRFFTEPENIKNDIAELIEDAGHIKKVLRMEIGDRIIVFDGSGFQYECELVEIENKVCRAKIIGKEESTSEPETKVYLFQGLPKSGKMETIIQKAVELGVYEVVPVIMDRCVLKLDEKAKTDKTKRWQKVAVEAVKQCGRGLVPKVHTPVKFSEAVKMLKELDLAFMPYEEMGHSGQRGLKELLKDFNGKSVGFIVGPEGGFSDAEVTLAKENKISTIGLGSRILRTETAGSTVISIIMYEFDEI